jgi:quinol monooxygenase YgiN
MQDWIRLSVSDCGSNSLNFIYYAYPGTNPNTMNESKTLYGFSGNFKTKSGKGSDMIAILLQAAEGVRTAKGCRLYIISQDEKDPDTIHVFETWDSREDHDNSLKMEGSKALIAQAMPLLDGKPQGMPLKVFGGAGLK